MSTDFLLSGDAIEEFEAWESGEQAGARELFALTLGRLGFVLFYVLVFTAMFAPPLALAAWLGQRLLAS